MLQEGQTKALLLRLSATAPRSGVFRHTLPAVHRLVLFKPETGLPPSARRGRAL